MGTDRTCTVVVLNHNGRDLLEQHMPSVAKAVASAGPAAQLLVVDNASTDGSEEFVRRAYPQARMLVMSENCGFGAANNAAIETCSTPLVMCLNNDIELAEDCLVRLLPWLDDDRVFSATPRMVRKSHHMANESVAYMHENRGLIEVEHPGLTDPSRKWPDPMELLYGSGGASVYRRDRFLQLGGFDALFDPFYHEDVDLGYNSCKRGWKNIYEPGALAIHDGGATFSRGGQAYERGLLLSKCHELLFFWKNVTDRDLIARHLVHWPVRILKALRIATI